jgi:hypothetical protein
MLAINELLTHFVVLGNFTGVLKTLKLFLLFKKLHSSVNLFWSSLSTSECATLLMLFLHFALIFWVVCDHLVKFCEVFYH